MCALCGNPSHISDAGETPIVSDNPSDPVAATTNESSDAAGSTATTYSLTPTQTVKGQIGVTGDTDWYRVDLTAGTYTFAVVGTGPTPGRLHDSYLYLRNSAGNILASDDDGGPGGNSTVTYTVSAGTYYLDVESYQNVNQANTGQYELSITSGSKPSYDFDMGAGALTRPEVTWSSPGTPATVTYGFRQSPAGYSVSGSDISTFTQVSAAEMAAINTIMQFWSSVCNITFTPVNPGGYTNNATILFGNYSSNDGAGAFAFYPGSTLSTSSAGDVWLNTGSVSTSSLPFGSYSFFAIMHEVGHALGLAHPSDYNAAPGVSITYSANAQWVQDSQQYTVMSYFDEGYTGSNYSAYADTPLMYDIYAAQLLYGANMTVRTDDTVYGFGSNAGSVYDFATNTHPGFCIWDAGGSDTLNCSGVAAAQLINLNAGTFSNVDGLTANVSISLGAIIENATGGSGNDTILGNSVANALIGGGGNDTITGGGGNDAMTGGSGTDIAVFSGAYSNYAISYNTSTSTYTLVDQRFGSPDGTDTVTGFEIYRFSDGDRTTIASSQPDLVISASSLSASTDYADTDTPFTASFNISNIGGASAGASTAGIYLSTDTSITTSDTLLSSFAIGALVAGGTSSSQGGALALPSGLTSGTYYIGFIADQSAAVTEGSETNNIGSAAFTLQVLFSNGDDAVTLPFAASWHAHGGNDIVTGTAGADTIYGEAGNDRLDGAAGADTLIGGIGNDIYIVDNTGDAVSENANEGNDIVNASVDFTLSANVEAVVLQGVGNLNAAGNGLDNALIGNSGNNNLDGLGGNDYMVGGAGNDVYFADSASDVVIENANEGNDIVYATFDYTIGANVESVVLVEGAGNLNAAGNSTNNALVGNSGNNALDGRGGDDYMTGGAGNDIYFADSAGDVVIENPNEGSDIVYATFDYTIGANVEAVVLVEGAGNINAAGNGTGNALIGNSGNNALDGRGGGDYLVGNGGNDTFVFARGEANGDIIADFAGNGAAAGDILRFVGYGTQAQGASLTQVDATHWSINSADGLVHDIVILQNGASVHTSDFLFV